MAAESTTTRGDTRKRSTQRKLKLRTQLGLRAGDALLVIDVQRDFLPGGSLAVPGGDEVVAPLNAYIAAFDAQHLPIIMTRDWHPANH